MNDDARLTSFFGKEVYEKLEILIEHTSGGVALLAVDGRRLLPLYISEGCYGHLDRDRIDFQKYSGNFLNLVVDKDRLKVSQAVEKAVSSGEPVDCFYRVFTKDNVSYRYAKGVRVPYAKSENPVLLVYLNNLSGLSDKERIIFENPELIMEINENISFFKVKTDENLTLISCNKSYCNFLGFADSDELIAEGGSETAKFIHEDSLRYVRQLLEETQKNGKKAMTTEMRITTPSGEDKWLLAWGTLVKDEDGSSVVACAVDNTTQKKIREEFNSVIDSINGGFIIWKVDESENLFPSVISDGYCNLLGYTLEELKEIFAAYTYKNVHPDDVSSLKIAIKKRLVSEGQSTFVHRLRKKDGKYIWVNVNWSVKFDKSNRTLYASYIDITELKNAENELSLRETAYHIAAEQSGKAIARYDIFKKTLYQQENFDVGFYSSAVTSGVPESTVLSGAVAPDSENTYLEFYRNMQNGIPKGSALLRMKNLLSGNFEWYSGDYTLIFDEEKKPRYSIISYSNVDKEYKLKKAEETRKKQENESLMMLIVDDMELNRVVLREIFENNFEILEAGDGEEALNILNVYGTRLSVLLLDIVMPKKNGIEVLREIQNHPEWAGVATVVISGGEETDYGLELIKLGAVEFLTKGANADIVRLRVSSALEKRAAERLRYENMLLQSGKADEERHIKELRRLAETDNLTGLLNRSAFTSAAQTLLETAKPDEYVVCVIDLDNFKVLNDLYGHEEGDKVLSHIASKLKTLCEQRGGLCCRISADNFGYIMKYDLRFFYTGGEIKVDLFKDYPLSFGFVLRAGRYVVNDLSLPISAMLDRAMIAKRSVKGVFRKYEAYYNEEMRETLIKEQTLVTDAEAAILNGEFTVYLQPKYSIETGRIVGAEALVRWFHPTRGFLTPAAFIPIFEHNGLIVRLDEYIWERTAQIIRGWINDGKEVVPVSVNISRMNIYNPKLVKTLTDIVKKYALSPKLLELELTESAFVQNPKQFIDIVKELRATGFIVEMDDFGSGYSSLSALRDIDVDVVKLDIRFMPPDSNDIKGKSILSTVVSLADLLRLNLVAEGVETEHQVEYLRSIGCDTAQGFYFAKPMPLSDFERLLKETNGG